MWLAETPNIFVKDTCPFRSIAVHFSYLNFMFLRGLNSSQKNNSEWIPLDLFWCTVTSLYFRRPQITLNMAYKTV